jgi:hypothetical protein
MSEGGPRAGGAGRASGERINMRSLYSGPADLRAAAAWRSVAAGLKVPRTRQRGGLKIGSETPCRDDGYGTGVAGRPGARSVSAQAGRKGRWAVSERLPILGRLLRTAQSAEPQRRREEGAMPERLVAVGRLLHTKQPMTAAECRRALWRRGAEAPFTQPRSLRLPSLALPAVPHCPVLAESAARCASSGEEGRSFINAADALLRGWCYFCQTPRPAALAWFSAATNSGEASAVARPPPLKRTARDRSCPPIWQR